MHLLEIVEEVPGSQAPNPSPVQRAQERHSIDYRPLRISVVVPGVSKEGGELFKNGMECTEVSSHWDERGSGGCQLRWDREVDRWICYVWFLLMDRATVRAGGKEKSKNGGGTSATREDVPQPLATGFSTHIVITKVVPKSNPTRKIHPNNAKQSSRAHLEQRLLSTKTNTVEVLGRSIAENEAERCHISVRKNRKRESGKRKENLRRTVTARYVEALVRIPADPTDPGNSGRILFGIDLFSKHFQLRKPQSASPIMLDKISIPISTSLRLFYKQYACSKPPFLISQLHSSNAPYICTAQGVEKDVICVRRSSTVENWLDISAVKVGATIPHTPEGAYLNTKPPEFYPKRVGLRMNVRLMRMFWSRSRSQTSRYIGRGVTEGRGRERSSRTREDTKDKRNIKRPEVLGRRGGTRCREVVIENEFLVKGMDVTGEGCSSWSRWREGGRGSGLAAVYYRRGAEISADSSVLSDTNN
ncbi:hypothetical protein BDQ17DRAFT_1328007 [Cyathus striatus]|nr:hypothetical protein BDQ17DRAFT_1328007 [Cyathus striatus]